MANAYYTCNLLPTELVSRCGYTPRWLGNYLQDPASPARRDALGVHPMTCPYVTKLVTAAEEVLAGSPGGAARGAAASAATAGAKQGAAVAKTPASARDGDCLVVPGGCDAMRRLGDLLAATYPDRVFVLSMPRSSGAAPASTLAADLARLDEWLRTRLFAGASPPAGDGLRSAAAADQAAADPQRGVADQAAAFVATDPAAAEPPTLDYPTPPRPGGVFLVAGPLSDDSLLRLIDDLGAYVSGLESCTSPDRWKPLAPAGAAGAPDAPPEPVAAAAGHRAGVGGPGGPDAAAPSDYEALAAHLLATGMCPRRSTVDRRDHLARRLDETRASSIIYARQSFCDPGAYDALLVAQLAAERRLPFLEIEVDFPFDAGGPLRTRVEAFLEAQLLDDDLLDSDDLYGGAASAAAPVAPVPPAAEEG